MALRDKLIKNTSEHLEPGEQPVAVFSAMTASGWWSAFGVLGMLIAGTRMRTVLVTTRGVRVFDSGFWLASTIKEQLAQFTHPATLGEPSGLWWKCEALTDALYVHKRFHKDVKQANDYLASQHQVPQPGDLTNP